MSAGAFLADLIGLLDRSRTPYMVAGSFASTYHGVPRTTQDLDLVVELDPSSLNRLLGALPEDRYYVSPEAARDAVRHRGIFNILDTRSGWKADIIVRKDRSFSREEFRRRVRARILGVEVHVVSAEDLVISKLEWAQLGGGSEYQLRDVAGVLATQGDALDLEHVARWVGKLQLGELYGRARAMAAEVREA